MSPGWEMDSHVREVQPDHQEILFSAPQRRPLYPRHRRVAQRLGAWTRPVDFDAVVRELLGRKDGPGHAPRRRTTIGSALGRSVTRGTGRTSAPGASATDHRRSRVASASVPSIHANPAPMHTRAPPPNGT
jgi:hypothetical protein